MNLVKLANLNNVVARLMLVTLLTLTIIPFGLTTRVNHATEGTTEATSNNSSNQSGSTNLDNISVSMDENGNVTVDGISDGNSTDTWQQLFNRYKIVIAGISGTVTLTFVVFFLKNFAAVGANSNNPQARREATNGCLWTGLAATGAGAVTIIVGLFWNFLR